jgi:hypothetical protein
MCDDLAKMLGVPPDQVLREEVGKVLSQAIKNTDAAEAASIKRHQAASTHSLQAASLYAPKRPGRRRLHKGRVLYNLSWKYPNKLWSAINRARAADLKKRLRARGLAKQSWFRQGLLLGLSVDAPEYVKKALATTGKEYPANESVNVSRRKGEIVIDTENSQPTVNAIGGGQALQRAIDGRSEYFFVNVSKDVFDNMDRVAKKYPGITINA